MTDEEIKKKCKERAKIFQQAMESCHSSSPMDCIEWFADRIAELEAQIEKMKCCINDLVHLGEFNEYTDEEYLNSQVHEALNNAEQFIKE